MVKNVEVAGVVYDVSQEEEYRAACIEVMKLLIDRLGTLRHG